MDHLDRLLEAAAEHDARVEAPPHLEASVLRVWDVSRRQKHPSPARSGAWRLAWWCTATMVAVAAMVSSIGRDANPLRNDASPADVPAGSNVGGTAAQGQGVLLV
ncbi:MAG TPA: hypothetical protein VEA16_13245, partial [Vicinamibacterales bacterium]|nr:hypothetical protein [Vicinamibacterales bacterium]